MPICPKCRAGYDEPAENCPKCGAAKPEKVTFEVAHTRADEPPYHCGQFAFFCLHYARVVAFIISILSIVGVVVNLGKAEWWEAAKFLLFAFPMAVGHYVALSLAVKYACRK